ncbi:mandelate racemase [Variovorax sp. OK605]|jgi:mandelate racemase|uniref:enolase C-terminal domain-like protein n=1 Tax=unclassified Variovorax TaxID=663243 RepID=UPI0008C0268B|nr:MULTISPECIES: enolase C-terminal domain-like protein [unclassified Variovorax]SEK12249.1 mandelate racemase [Variovorax sp. OK202]SFD80053.1 mandelate racemase [Variovorax sp. OK212]SFP57911.1 mandelate racemase [Variovorax sp. OK605]
MNTLPDTGLLVADVQARCVNVPLEHPVRTSVGVVATAPLVLVDLYASDGTVGRAYVFTYTPLALRATRRMLLTLGGALAGQPLAPFDLDQTLAQRLRLLGRTGIAQMASAGLDMAAWDALAKVRGVPLVELLGGTRRPVAAYDSHSMDGVALGVRRAALSMEQGFGAIKTKVGYATLGEDLEVVRALRRVIGDGTQLLVDYNQGLTVPEAVRRIHALEGEGIGWVEEPTLQEDYAGHARIRERVRLPVQMGENWCGPDEMAKALQAGACDLAMPDAMKIGGVTGWLRAAALAQAHGVPMSSHIFQEVSVHLLAVTPTRHLLERMDLAAPVLAQPLAFENGMATAPAEPGTGIAWNEDAVRRYLV